MSYYHSIFNLEGKTAVVTGGAGILGQKFCAGLAEFGANVAVVDINETLLSKFVEQLSPQYTTKIIGVVCDISSPQSVQEMVQKVSRALGPIDILHNNAATKTNNLSSFFESVEDFNLETWREVMAVNLDGLFLVSKIVGGEMAKRNKGSIIHTASIYGLVAPDQRIYEGSEYLGKKINTPPVYAASKGGVLGLTKYLATYWAHRGVRVNALTPGGVESGQNDTFKSQYSQRVPLGRMAQAEEMVGALIFLASEASSYITGQNIIIDGGLTAW